jgi:hypothetical protein
MLENSNALVFQVREAAMSRGIIEKLKTMQMHAESIGNAKLKDKLEVLLKDAIKHQEQYKVLISDVGEDGATRLRNTLIDVAGKAENIFRQIAEDREAPKFLRQNAESVLSDARRIITDYDHIVANKYGSFQKAAGLLEIAEVARRGDLTQQVLREEIRSSSFDSNHPVMQLL